jgi:hypothetical protein
MVAIHYKGSADVTLWLAGNNQFSSEWAFFGSKAYPPWQNSLAFLMTLLERRVVGLLLATGEGFAVAQAFTWVAREEE